MNHIIKNAQAARVRYALHYGSADTEHSKCTGRQVCASLLDTRKVVKLSGKEMNRPCCAGNQ
jgi:hypothetical protein